MGEWFDGDLCATLHRFTIHVTATVGRTREIVLDGDPCATLHRCTIHVTATVGRTREMVLDGDPCATLHGCTLHVILKQLVERGSYKWFRMEMYRQRCTNDNYDKTVPMKCSTLLDMLAILSRHPGSDVRVSVNFLLHRPFLHNVLMYSLI